MYKHVLSCIKMNIVFGLRAIYGHFAGTPFIQPRLASVKEDAILQLPVKLLQLLVQIYIPYASNDFVFLV